MGNNRFDIIHGNIDRVTNSAILLETQNNAGVDVTVWVPRSVIQDGEDVEIGLRQDLEVKTWFLEKNELI